MANDLGMTLPSIMAGPTIMLIVMAMVSWLLRKVFENHGARPVMVFGSPVGGLGLLVLALANGPTSYFLSWTILGFAGACVLTTPAQIAVAEVAQKGARYALSILVLAGGLTSTIVWPLTGFLQGQFGWRTTTLIYALLMLLVCMPLHWVTLARQPLTAQQKTPDDDIAPIDSVRFALLAISFAASGFFTWGFALTVILLFEAAGLDHASALTAASLIGIAQWAGRMADLMGGGRLSAFVTGLVGSALFPVSLGVLLLTDSFSGAVIFAALYGVASGVIALTRATLPLEMFASGAYARASAQLAVPLNFSFAAAPPAFTWILTNAGPKAALYSAQAISIFAFITLFALFLVHRRREHRPYEEAA